jgi:hypothetical protein
MESLSCLICSGIGSEASLARAFDVASVVAGGFSGVFEAGFKSSMLTSVSDFLVANTTSDLDVSRINPTKELSMPFDETVASTDR